VSILPSNSFAVAPVMYAMPSSDHRHPVEHRHSVDGHRHPVEHRQWNSNICDCCIDVKSCCHAFLCPCCAFARVVRNMEDRSGCCRGCCCLVCPFSVFIRAPYRKQLRVKYNLPAKPCNDCCTACWCPCCALAQELREIKHHTQSPPVQSMK